MTIFGVDISNWQAGLDLRRVKAEGFEFVICKVSEGSGYKDPTWPGFRDEARDAGLLLAGYHYVRADSDAGAQAQTFIDHLGDLSIPVMLDHELNSGGIDVYWNVVRELNARGCEVDLTYLPRWYWQGAYRCPGSVAGSGSRLVVVRVRHRLRERPVPRRRVDGLGAVRRRHPGALPVHGPGERRRAGDRLHGVRGLPRRPGAHLPRRTTYPPGGRHDRGRPQDAARSVRLVLHAEAVAGGVAVAFGVVDAGQVDQWVSIVAGFIGVGAAGTALKHVRPATTQAVVAVEDVLAALKPNVNHTYLTPAPSSGDPRAADVARLG